MTATSTVFHSDPDILGGTRVQAVVFLQLPKERNAGLHIGAIGTSPDFDAPLPNELWTGG